MILRVAVTLSGIPDVPRGVSFTVLDYHDDGTATVRTRGPGADPGIDGLIYRIGLTSEPRERRHLQRQAEALIDSLDDQERTDALAKYRGE